jgi:N-acetylglutamate synthase-like GNAT family acetyltransferase
MASCESKIGEIQIRKATETDIAEILMMIRGLAEYERLE